MSKIVSGTSTEISETCSLRPFKSAEIKTVFKTFVSGFDNLFEDKQ